MSNTSRWPEIAPKIIRIHCKSTVMKIFSLILGDNCEVARNDKGASS